MVQFDYDVAVKLAKEASIGVSPNRQHMKYSGNIAYPMTEEFSVPIGAYFNQGKYEFTFYYYDNRYRIYDGMWIVEKDTTFEIRNSDDPPEKVGEVKSESKLIKDSVSSVLDSKSVKESQKTTVKASESKIVPQEKKVEPVKKEKAVARPVIAEAPKETKPGLVKESNIFKKLDEEVKDE